MSKSRQPLTPNEERELWSLSGGICANPKCNRELLFEDLSKSVNVSDQAHVIAHSGRGPRAGLLERYGLAQKDLDGPKNRLLLCKICHHIVDDNEKDYPPETLFEWKRTRENQVLSLRAKKQDCVCIIHKTKGPPFDSLNLASQVNANFTARVVYQRDLDSLERINWGEEEAKNESIIQETTSHCSSFPGSSIMVFPLSPIPLLVHLGSLLTDTIPVKVFQYDRRKQVWVYNSPEPVASINATASMICNHGKRLAVCVEISGSIGDKDLTDCLGKEEFDVIRIGVSNPLPDRVLYSEQIASVRDTFRDAVLTALGKGVYQEVHLLCAVPAGLAVELGRSINRNMWPPVHLYQYHYSAQPRYERAITVAPQRAQ